MSARDKLLILSGPLLQAAGLVSDALAVELLESVATAVADEFFGPVGLWAASCSELRLPRRWIRGASHVVRWGADPQRALQAASHHSAWQVFPIRILVLQFLNRQSTLMVRLFSLSTA